MTSFSWTKIIQTPKLQRSSHIVSVLNNTAYIYGGELLPRQPRDNHVYSLDAKSPDKASLTEIEGSSSSPSPRVGTASSILGDNVYIYSGRGGEAMAPIEESGSVWKLEPSTQSWKLIEPSDPSALNPPARSYHCSTSNNEDKIFIHAGCPETGRLADLWSFDPSTRTWTELAAAPGPARGGTSIAFHEGLLYRMNGFDGKSEQGGALDIYDVASDSWSTKAFVADGVSGPSPRSVSSLLVVHIGGKPHLVTLFGERDPSSLGHQGAGKMLGDIWAYEIASGKWSEISTGSDATQKPAPRGWFDADVVGQSAIIVTGGLGESNQRFDDAWILQM